MTTRLRHLLAAIEKAPDVTERRADRGLNCFRAPAAVITDWEQYKQLLAQFYCEVESAILNLSRPRQVDREFDLQRCWQLLGRKYGRNAPQAVFELVRTGNEGGLRKVLRTTAREMAREYSEREIEARVSAYWHGHSPDELLADADDYLAHFGHLLPSELTEGSAARIRANFSEVLAQHPFLLKRLRESVRR